MLISLREKPKMEFVEVQQPSAWKPEKDGDNIEGELTAKKTHIGVNDSNLYHLKKDDVVTSIWGSKVLDQRLELVEVGTYVRITYKGTEKNKKGQDVKIFKVEKGKEEAETPVETVDIT